MEIRSNYEVGYNTATYKEGITHSKIQKDEKPQSNGDKVQEYYDKLCKKFPDISFNTSGGELACGKNKVVVNLSYDCLKKMANDPEFAKKIEWNLSGEVEANSQVYSFAKRDGVELGGRTVTYDADGNRQSSCGGMRTAASGMKKNKGIQNKSKSLEERIREKRKERKKTEARLEEKRRSKMEFEERIAELRDERSVYRDRSEESSDVKKYQNMGIVSAISSFDANA